MAEGDPIGWAEPLPFAEVKARLGVRNNHRDDEIARNTKTARELVEEMSFRILTRRTFKVTRRGVSVAAAVASVPGRPFVELVGVRVRGDDAWVELIALPDVVQVDDELDVFGATWTTTWSYVEVEYVAGYGGDGEPVPETLIQAMMLLVGHWFENHEGAVIGTVGGKLPFGVEELCQGKRPPGIIG
jgi:uncharacterized phiE125 gp8 family phage protein